MAEIRDQKLNLLKPRNVLFLRPNAAKKIINRNKNIVKEYNNVRLLATGGLGSSSTPRIGMRESLGFGWFINRLGGVFRISSYKG